MSLTQELSPLRKEFPYSIFVKKNQRTLYSSFGTYTDKIEDLKLSDELNTLLKNTPFTKEGDLRFKIEEDKIIWYKH